MLPKLPYVMKKNRQQTVAMRGINFSNATADGDVADSKGIGAQAYPYLATRKGRVRLADEISDVIDFTYFYGKKVEVRAEEGGAGLYYGGFRVCDVTLSEKQFAKINTKLVIFPDKIYLEKSGLWNYLGAKRKAYHAKFDKKFVELGETISDIVSGYGGTFEGDTFTAVGDRETWTNVHLDVGSTAEGLYVLNFFEYKTKINRVLISGSLSANPPLGGDASSYYDLHFILENDEIKQFGIDDINDVEGNRLLAYHIRFSGKYDIHGSHRFRPVRIRKESGELIQNKVFVDFYAPVYIGSGETSVMMSGTLELFKTIDIGAIQVGDYIQITYPDGETHFHSVKKRTGSLYVGPAEDGSRPRACDGATISTMGWPKDLDFTQLFTAGYDIVFSVKSNVGDQQNIRNDNRRAVIAEVAERSIKIVTKEAVEGSEDEAIEGFETEELKEAAISLCSSADGDKGKFAVGDAVTISGSTVAENNTTFIIDKIDGSTFYSASEIFTPSEQDVVLTIEREIPKLDFICESNNRLWGCSNKDSTIYSSALGDPTNIYAYKDLSTDSYAVAVASSGDFTACCRYGDAVLFWKQDKLYKLLGSYPSEYALYDYDIDGVQAGAHESIAIINEALYYKGVHGVYVYRGGTPQLISQNFGDRRFIGGTGGGYGNRYYFSTSDGERDYLFVYDTLLGMWVLEDDIRVRTFFRKDGDELYMLTEGGEVYLCDAGESETGIEWFVQFTPFYETIEGRKSYSRIKLRVEVPQGSYMAVSVRCDGGRWHECGKIVGKNAGVIPVAIPINRCDKFEIKLGGKGKCTILSMLREFYLKGDK